MSLGAVSEEDNRKILQVLDGVTLRDKHMYVIIRMDALEKLSAFIREREIQVYTISKQEMDSISERDVAALIVGSLEYIQELLSEMKLILKCPK